MTLTVTGAFWLGVGVTLLVILAIRFIVEKAPL